MSVTHWHYHRRTHADNLSIGNLRFALPQPVGAYTGVVNASAYGPACPQQTGTALNTTYLPMETLDILALLPPSVVGEEDCKVLLNVLWIENDWIFSKGLSLNVIRPNGTYKHKLPVVVVSLQHVV